MLATLKRTLFGDAHKTPDTPLSDLMQRRAERVAKQSAGRPMPVRERIAMGQNDPSFTDMLSFVDYDPAAKTFLLSDCRSSAVLFELSMVPSEGRTLQFLTKVRDAAMQAISVIPQEDEGEWVLQAFVSDDVNLTDVSETLHDYIKPEIRKTEFTQHFLGEMNRHYSHIAHPSGLFFDPITETRFRGQRRRARIAIYRKYPLGQKSRDHKTADEQLKDVAEAVERGLKNTNATRMTGKDFYEWMFPWLNTGAQDTRTPAELLARNPYLYDDDDPHAERVYGRDYAVDLLLEDPVSDAESGTWRFNGRPFQALTIEQLGRVPSIGHMTGERESASREGNSTSFALMDKLPDGTMVSISVAIRPQDRVRSHVKKILKASQTESAESQLAKANCEAVEFRMVKGDWLLPTQIVIYAQGDNDVQLRERVANIHGLLANNSMKVIDRQSDLLALELFIRGLPMCFDPEYDRKVSKRARLTFLSHVCSMLPIYGRSRGTGRPGLTMWNRGGESITFDPYSKKDRKKNGHGGLFGPTGAGKSATAVYKLMSSMAVYRPWQFITDAGNSFGLYAAYCRSKGLKVNQVTCTPNADVSLPPFADAYAMLDRIEQDQAQRYLVIKDDADELEEELAAAQSEESDTNEAPDSNADKTQELQRDLMGEMEITCRIMVTGGEEKEIAAMTRSDRALIRRAIIEGSQKARDENKPHPLTEDIANTLARFSKDDSLPQPTRQRAYDMSAGLQVFCEGMYGRFFNRYGKSWPEADVTILELGILATEGYEDGLAVAFTSYIRHIHAFAETNQHQHRIIEMLTDEAHLVFTNELLALIVVKIVKMWRKLGAWFWLATQNLEDFPDSSRRMLTMLEWWMILTMGKDELENLRRFKLVPEELEKLILATRKEPGLYTEGVIMSDAMGAQMYRNVPPALALALAMTEKEEKAERGDIMREKGCSELEAVYEVVRRIEARRTKDQVEKAMAA